MESSLQHQIIALIERSEKILLCTHRKPDGDAVGSIMAMYKALSLLGKEVTAACADQLPDTFQFLPEIDHLTQEVPGNRDFVVTLDCEHTEVDRLKYHLEDNKIHIVITPKKGRFFQENVSCQERTDHYDLIITLDVADVPQLGKLYEENRALFTSVPIVNIDHHISNTQFGKLNWVDAASSSTSEMLYQLIREMEKHFQKTLIVPETATFLLSGVTTDTGSFQNANTTPRAMEVAADLMDAGANQQDIIKYLFRTKKLTTLKLWGRILSKIEVDAKHRLVWSSITQQDLQQTGSHSDDSGDIIDELMVHAPEADIVVLFKEDPDMIGVSLRSKSAQANVMEVAQQFGGGGHVQAAGVKFYGKTLQEVMNLVLSTLQERQRKRLGLDGGNVPMPGQPQITQVLDGYTPMTEPVVKPSLEERVVGAPPLPPPNPLPKGEGTPLPPQSGSPKPTPAPKQIDLHDKAKAAIAAEQSQPAADAFKPSQATTQERPKPVPEKRFTGEVPEFLKQTPPVSPTPSAPPTPPSPPPQAPLTSAATELKADEGVKVTYQAPSTPPEIPANSSEPVVKTVKPATPANPLTPEATASQETPKPPKDPFALGDDGLTDIERALGGL